MLDLKTVYFVMLVNTSCLKIVDNVPWLIILATTSGHDWQPSWMLRPLLKSKLFVT